MPIAVSGEFSTNKRYFILSGVCLFLAGAAAALIACVLLINARFGGREGLHDAFRLVQARNAIQQNFVQPLDDDVLTEGAIAGMVKATGDQWSYYMTGAEFEAYQNYAANLMPGIGITVREETDRPGLTVVEVLEGSPSDSAGITAGMLLVEVDGQSMAGKSATEARQAILSAGDVVPLVLEREDGERVSLNVPLGNIPRQVVFSAMLEPGIGYIGIANFETGAAGDAIDALKELREAGAEKIVFDVRNNPGGQLSELTSLLDYLLPEGELFISRDREGKETVRSSGPTCIEMPMAVLVNENSVSAAEFFAAALSEYDWAEIVGSPTTGKARSQVNIFLMDGDVIHLSTASYLTPKRVDLTETGGLAPDIAIEPEEGSDTQLEAAIECLRAQP